MTLVDYADQEHLLVRANLSAAGRYGYYAEIAVGILSSSIVKTERTYGLMMGQYSTVRKSLMLASLSTLCQHRVQASTNLRQAIENTVFTL